MAKDSHVMVTIIAALSATDIVLVIVLVAVRTVVAGI